MTPKDYIAIAHALSATRQHETWDDESYREGWHAALSAVASRLADYLVTDNKRFDRRRFLAAALGNKPPLWEVR